ncbi:MAG: caspase family protein [Candidatus Poribacteria bacterium]|nr:caspase family protein [Candidatus Poribacteria bacterium]
MTASATVWALSVGTNVYDDFTDLNNPVLDAKTIDSELRSRYAAATELLLDPSRAGFLTALNRLADHPYEENDRLIIFITGHGFFDARLKRGYLVFRDSGFQSADPLRDTWVSLDDVRATVEGFDCPHILLVVDSCFSGTLDPSIRLAADSATKSASAKSLTVAAVNRGTHTRTRRYLTAGGKEYVFDGTPGSHSPFAARFIDALRTDGGKDAVLTFGEIVQNMNGIVPEPRHGVLFGNDPDAEFMLFAGGTVPDELIAPPPDADSTPLTDEHPLVQVEIYVEPTYHDIAMTEANSGRRHALSEAQRSDFSSVTFQVPPGEYDVRAYHREYRTAVHRVVVASPRESVRIVLESVPTVAQTPSVEDVPIPDWYLQPPEGVNGVGTGVSDDLDSALSLAEAAAKSELSRFVQTFVGNRIQTVRREANRIYNPDADERLESISTDQAEALLRMARVTRRYVRREGTLYRVFVLVEVEEKETLERVLSIIREDVSFTERERESNATLALEREIALLAREAFEELDAEIDQLELERGRR